MFRSTPEFVPHRAGFTLTFDNGYEVSVQWGPGTYSESGKVPSDAASAEVAVFDPAGKFVTGVVCPDYTDHEVAGWLKADAVAEIIDRVRRLT